MEHLIAELCDQLISQLRQYEAAKDRYAHAHAVYRRAHEIGQPDAGRAATQRATAIADCQWYAADVQTIGVALTALCAYEGVRRG